MFGTVLATVKVVVSGRCRSRRRAPRCGRSPGPGRPPCPRPSRDWCAPAAPARTPTGSGGSTGRAPSRRSVGSAHAGSVGVVVGRCRLVGSPAARVRRAAAAGVDPDAGGEEQHGRRGDRDGQRHRAVLRHVDPQRHRLTVRSPAAGVQRARRPRPDRRRSPSRGPHLHLAARARSDRLDGRRAAAAGSAASSRSTTTTSWVSSLDDGERDRARTCCRTCSCRAAPGRGSRRSGQVALFPVQPVARGPVAAAPPRRLEPRRATPAVERAGHERVGLGEHARRTLSMLACRARTRVR